MFSFRYTSGVCKHVVQDGPKMSFKHLFMSNQILMDFADSISVMPSDKRTVFNEDLW